MPILPWKPSPTLPWQRPIPPKPSSDVDSDAPPASSTSPSADPEPTRPRPRTGWHPRLHLPDPLSPQQTLVLGRKRSGKTSLVRELVSSSLDGASPTTPTRVLVVDFHGEYGDLLTPVRSHEEFEQVIADSDGAWRIAYHNDSLSLERKGGDSPEYDYLVRACYEMGNCVLVNEETGWICDPHRIPLDLERAIKFGGHRILNLILLLQRAPDVHILVRSEASEVYAFSTQEPGDLEYLAKRCGDEVARIAATLPPHRYIYQDLNDRSQPAQLGETKPEFRAMVRLSE
jgi:hypothetical protein